MTEEPVIINLDNIEVPKPKKRKRKEPEESEAPINTEQVKTEQEEPSLDPELAQLLLAPVIRALYKGLGQIEALVATKKTGCSYELAQTAFSYSDSELELLTPPTASIIAKYGGGLVRFKEELELVILLSSLHIEKFRQFKELLHERGNLRQTTTRQEHPSTIISDRQKETDSSI